MTQQEQKSLIELTGLLTKIATENRVYRELLTGKVDGLEKKVEEKHIPIVLEDEIMKAVQGAILKSMTDALTGYQSPLTKYTQNVVTKYQTQIEGIFDEVVKESIGTDEFRQRVREVLLNKIAKTMISGIDGSIDKTINLMKQDAIFRSRLTLSVNTLVDEFLNQKK